MIEYEYTCILCPRGCRLKATQGPEGVQVTGNACPRGIEYAIAETTDPRRTVTTSVYAQGGDMTMVSVKTSEAVPRAKVEAVLKEAAAAIACAPVEVGDVLVKNVAGTGTNLIATRRLAMAKSERKTD